MACCFQLKVEFVYLLQPFFGYPRGLRTPRFSLQRGVTLPVCLSDNKRCLSNRHISLVMVPLLTTGCQNINPASLSQKDSNLRLSAQNRACCRYTTGQYRAERGNRTSKVLSSLTLHPPCPFWTRANITLSPHLSKLEDSHLPFTTPNGWCLVN